MRSTTLRRVAYVCTDPGIPAFGRKGASVHVQAVLRVLRRHAVEVHLVCPRLGGETPDGLQDVVVHQLPAIERGEPAAREISAQLSDAAVAAVLNRLHHDSPLDLVYERFALWGRTATGWAAGQGVPSVLEVNAPLIDEQRRHRVLIDGDGAERAAGAALRNATAVVAVSEGVADWTRGYRGPTTPLAVVPNGVDTARVRPSPGPVRPAAAAGFTLGFVGTLKPWHGVEQLLEAMALLLQRSPDYRCLVVGDGPQLHTLRRQAAALGISHAVELTGSVAPDDVPALLRRMDLAVAPYPADTSFYFSPLKIFEYLAAGLPVVASRLGSIPELLEFGRWGALTEPGDAADLARHIDGLRHAVQRRQQIRDEAPVAAQSHDWEHVVRRTLSLVGLDLGVLSDVR